MRHAGITGIEGNVEVMLAGKAGFLHPLQGAAHYAAQRLLGQEIVTHQVFGHRMSFRCGAAPSEPASYHN